jgi:hypothetical protein
MKTKKISKLTNLLPDRLNANKGTERGNAFYRVKPAPVRDWAVNPD